MARIFDPGIEGVTLQGAPRMSAFFESLPVMPDLPGIRGHYVMRRNVNVSRRNYAEGGAAATVIGAPAFPADDIGIITDKANCLNTGLDLTPNATYCGIAKVFNTTTVLKKSLLGNFSGSANILSGDMVAVEENLLKFYAGRSVNAASDNIALPMTGMTPDDYYWWAGTVTGGPSTVGVQDLYLGYKGVLTDATNETQASRPAAGIGRPLKIGGSDHASSYTTPGTEFEVCISSVAWSAAQINALYAATRAWAASEFGIVI